MTQTTLWLDVVVPTTLILLWVALSPLPSYFIFWRTSKSRLRKGRSSSSTEEKEREDREDYSGYIIPVLIHHARILPRESQHSFRYPSIFLAFNLENLENGKVEDDLCSNSSSSFQTILSKRVFAWQPRCNGRWSLTKLDPQGFGRRVFTGMKPEMQRKLKDSILFKLMYELRLRGYIRKGPQDLVDDDHSSSDKASLALPWSDQVGQVWAVAMPSLLGMGGFNPLTIYYVYRPSSSIKEEEEEEEESKRGKLWLVILEVHNTFNERHVYICQVGKNEDENVESTRRRKYQYSWTFPRAFHVSPFNDRSGYYQLLMNDLWESNSKDANLKDDRKGPTLDIRLLLMTEVGGEEEEEEEVDEEGKGEEERIEDTNFDKAAPVMQKKLLATLCSRDAPSASLKSRRDVQVLTALNLVKSLSAQPFDLILPVSRIMWQAAKLHWKRKLPVFIRPEQRGEGLAEGQEGVVDDNGAIKEKKRFYDGIGWPLDLNPSQQKQDMSSSSSGAIYWNQDGFIEKACQRQFEEFLLLRTKERLEIMVSIISRNAEVPQVHFFRGERVSKPRGDATQRLIIFTLSSNLFVDFALYTPAQARLFGSVVDRNWGINSIELFESIFSTTLSNYPKSWKGRLAAWIRQSHMQWASLGMGFRHIVDKGEIHQRYKITQHLLEDLATSHPYNQYDPPLSFILALFFQVIVIKLTAFFSNLLHIRYVRAPWSSVGEGIEYLQKQHKDTPCI